jgi:hypothetical protein
MTCALALIAMYWGGKIRYRPIWQSDNTPCLDFILTNPYPRPSSGHSMKIPFCLIEAMGMGRLVITNSPTSTPFEGDKALAREKSLCRAVAN